MIKAEDIMAVPDIIEEAASRLSSIKKTFRHAVTLNAREAHGTALIIDDIMHILDDAKQTCLDIRDAEVGEQRAEGQ